MTKFQNNKSKDFLIDDSDNIIDDNDNTDCDLDVRTLNYDECVNYGYDTRNKQVLYHISIQISKSKVSSHYMDSKNS